jgi:superfamily I DNA/RNA helicase
MKESVFEYTNRVPRPLVTFLSHGILLFEAAPLLQDLDSPTRFGNKRERTKRIRAFEASWARLQHEEPGWAHDPQDIEFEDALKEWLRFHQCMLIGELVPETLTFLRNNPTSSALEVFEHVLVDEYQDLNKAEQVLIDLLVGCGSLGVIGDADQSIYSFRYAHPTGIVEFAETHPDTDDHELDECRRCPKRVVAMADHLIRHNHPPGSPPRIVARKTNPVGEVHIIQWNTIDDEIEGVAKFVAHLIDDRQLNPGEILVLCPRRLIGYGVRDALVKAGKPTHSFYHEEALEEDKAQEAFAFLTLLAHQSDRVALRFLLGFGSQTWLAEQYERVRGHCENTSMSPWNAMLRLAAKRLIIPKTSNLQKRFAEISSRLNKFKNSRGQKLVDALFPEDAEWAQVLREASLLTCDDETEPSELLDDLRTRITQPEMPDAGDFVRIMSLHKSKGLTSRAVIVCGCVDGLIPFRDEGLTPREQRESLREQRRLFYVAMTRCTEILLLSSFRQIKASLAYKIGAKVTRGGLNKLTVSSPFFTELGPSAPRPYTGIQFRLLRQSYLPVPASLPSPSVWPIWRAQSCLWH